MAINSEKLVRLLRDANVMEPLDIQRIKILQRKFDAGQKLSLKEFGLLREYSMQLVEEVFNNMSKDWEGELNSRFLKVDTPPVVKVSDSSLAEFI